MLFTPSIARSLLVVIVTFLVISPAAANETEFPNELSDFKLYGRGRLDTIRIKTSSESDVKSVFGSNCDWTYCPLDENWEVMFVYFDSFSTRRRTVGDKTYQLSLFPQFCDRIFFIRFRPKPEFRLNDSDFSTAFTSRPETRFHSGFKTLVFSDGKGLTYTLSEEPSDRGRLVEIDYFIPETDQTDIFFMTGVEDNIEAGEVKLISITSPCTFHST